MNGLGRSSALIAAGTIVSRITGLIRSLALVYVLGGQGRASDAFGTANQLPNNIFMIISTGVLTAVIVPQIVKWSMQEDRGEAHISKFLTLGGVVLAATTVVSMLLAVPLVFVYSAGYSAAQRDLAVAFALWCLPQIFFFGMFALIGETLNARRVFGPYAWAPIVNNVVSIAGLVVFAFLFGTDQSALSDWSAPGGGWNQAMVATIGAVITGGIVAQLLVLLLFWRRTGLHLRLDFHWRGSGLGAVGRMAGWTFLIMIVGQVVSALQSVAVTSASGDTSTLLWQNMWLVFMVPYSVIVLSIGTPLFTQISEHAGAGRTDAVRTDLGRAIRLLGVLCVGAVAVLGAAAPAIARVYTSSPAEGEPDLSSVQSMETALVLIGFLLSLVPLAIQFVVQRTFYAYGDTRTPFWFTVFQAVIAVGLAFIAMALLAGDEGKPYLTAAVATGQSISSISQMFLATWLLRRKIGPLGLRSAATALARFMLAGAVATAVGIGVFLWSGGVGGWMLASQGGGFLGCLVLGPVVLIAYVVALALLRSDDLKTFTQGIRRRFRR